MPRAPYYPLYEYNRGSVVESIQYGSIAVMDSLGRLVACYGNPDVVTYMRSSAKPLQALPFLEGGGQEAYNLNTKEIAILCASHTGMDRHVAVVEQLQAKTGVSEDELLCGIHPVRDHSTALALEKRGLQPTSNRHNCSGKHTGMLAYLKLEAHRGKPYRGDLPYTHIDHPIQKKILSTLAEMSGVRKTHIHIGVDGCSAPNYAISLKYAALAFARMCDPYTGQVKSQSRVAACKSIVSSMTSHPDLIAGPDRFDTCLMEVTEGRLIAKSGAEGYQAIGIQPDVLGAGSPAFGITIKIADGDKRGTAGPAVAVEVLRQLQAITPVELNALSGFGPVKPLYNWQNIEVGESRTSFRLKRF